MTNYGVYLTVEKHILLESYIHHLVFYNLVNKPSRKKLTAKIIAVKFNYFNILNDRNVLNE